MTTSIVFMTIGTIFGVALCFFNKKFRKPYLFIRNTIFAIWAGLTVALLVYSPPLTLTVTIGSLWQMILTNTVWWHLILKVLCPLILVLAIVFLTETGEKVQNFFSLALTAPVAASAIYFFAAPNLNLALIIAGAGFVVLGIGSLFFGAQYFSIEGSILGALVISLLFSNFYLLPKWVFFLIWALLASVGSLAVLLSGASKSHKVDSQPPVEAANG